MPATPIRPAAEALLAEMRSPERGRLKIFLGASPGVGKTYEMLSVARRKVASGMNVVVGIVETHGRPETDALLTGLPTIPRRMVEYRGRLLPELDLDALLARKPQLALIDELAHTNVPGSRHAKRHQDIAEVLDAGIDVYTTVNVQHLESFNDLVERITGVEVRETVPDSVLEAADVELIDLPPEDLLERLRQGKVYVPEQARRAIDNFFSRGNLLALRELALRAAAERVDDDLSTFMRTHAIEGPWPTRGRLIVCIDAREEGEALVRTAKRLADQRHVPWTAVHVQTLGAIVTPRQRAQLEATLALAEELGGETATISGIRVGSELLAYARQHNAAQLLVGRPQRASLSRWWRGSLADWLIDHAKRFEVTVASVEDEEATAAGAREPRTWRLSPPRVESLLLAGASVAAAALICWPLERWLSTDNLALIFLLAVIIAGGIAGLGAALTASVLSFLVYNFVFTQPRFSLAVDSPEDATTLIAFLVVAAVIGTLAGRLRQHAADARRNTARVETLFEFSRRLATAVDQRDLLLAAAQGLGEILGTRCVVLRVDAENAVEVPQAMHQSGEFRDIDRAASEWAAAHRESAGLGTSTLPAAGWHFVPLTAGNRTLGVVAVEARSGGATLSASERRLLSALQAQLVTALERHRLQRVSADARVHKEAEDLRSALLASVSHDLRTPLVSIIGSISALRDIEARLSAADRAELIATALLEAERLNRFVQNLLDMTRLSYGALRPRLTSVEIADIVAAATRRLAEPLQHRRPQVNLPAGLPSVRGDAVLLEQVVVNLLDNAAKYSPPDAPITIEASVAKGQVTLAITDRGGGMTDEERMRAFDLFYRARQRDSAVSGSGLGLPICKGFVEAMGGRIVARAGPDGVGATILITLPVHEPLAESQVRATAEGS
jgi:two-component system sensor histidine kinase KdpD